MMPVMQILTLLVFVFRVYSADVLDPIADDVHLFESFKTELFLDRSGVETGDPIVILPYVAGKDSQMWSFVYNDTESLYMFKGAAAQDYIFVDGEEGSGLTAGPTPALFARLEIKPYTFSFVLHLSSLAITAPANAGQQVTVQEYNPSNIAQHWAFIIPS